MNYLKMLEHSYEVEREDDAELDRFEYLSENIFNFTTYDSYISNLFGKKALEACLAITNRATFDYIEDKENYQWYLLMVNTPFFDNKLEWGTSVRGAWWDLHGKNTFKLHSCGVYENRKQTLDLEFDVKQWDEFVNAMVEFSKVDSFNTSEQ